MNLATRLAGFARFHGDPRVLQSGPSSLGAADQLGRALGWFSIGLGLSQLLAAPRYTRSLGVEGNEWFVRACGMREIAHGMLSLSTERRVGLLSRVAGDALDIGALLSILRDDNPRRENVVTALTVVLGITLLDLTGAVAITKRHRPKGQARDYRDRSGFPQGLERARGAAADFAVPDDIGAESRSARRTQTASTPSM